MKKSAIRSGIGMAPFSMAMHSTSICSGSADPSSYFVDLQPDQPSDGLAAPFGESVLS